MKKYVASSTDQVTLHLKLVVFHFFGCQKVVLLLATKIRLFPGLGHFHVISSAVNGFISLGLLGRERLG